MTARSNLVLVTGSTGWLGKRFVRLLATDAFDHDALREWPSGLRIRCMVLPGENGDELRRISGNIEVFAGDVRNSHDCAKFLEGAKGGLLFHTAGIIHPPAVKDFYEINVEGTKNLLQSGAAAGLA